MKKIIALALALIMALSMGVVAFAAATPAADFPLAATAGGFDANYSPVDYVAVYDLTKVVYPGSTVEIPANGADWKLSGYDFTTKELEGASLIESVKMTKEKDAIRITVKESYTMEEAKMVQGVIKMVSKTDSKVTYTIGVAFNVNNIVNDTLVGARKAADITTEQVVAAANTVQIMDEDGGFVAVKVAGDLAGTVKMGKEEKVFFNVVDLTADQKDALEEALGEDYIDEAIYETYTFETRAFKEIVDWTYDAYAEDPHFFYAWDGEKFVDLEGAYNDDEDVEAYEFSAAAEGTIIVTDTEIVLAAEETKNPDTGANDVVGVAAALAVVSLVAAGAVSLKK